jgi:hypothetical protein
MIIVRAIVRLPLGLVFLVFGLNAFLQFSRALYPAASPDSFLRLYSSRHYGLAIGTVQVSDALIVGFVLLFHYRQYFSGVFTAKA